MINLKGAKTRVTVGDSRTLTRTKQGIQKGYQRREGKIHNVTLSNMDVISGLYGNIFSVTRALQKGFQVTSEGENLIPPKKNRNSF